MPKPFKRVLIVLDACRYDSYLKADTKVIDENIGLPEKVLSTCNRTEGSFLYMMTYNRLHMGMRGEIQDINFIKKLYYRDVNTFLFTPLPTLNDDFIFSDGFWAYFQEWKLNNKMNCIEEIIEDLKDIDTEHEHYIVIWAGETHYPYSYGLSNLDGHQLPNWEMVKQYNNGEEIGINVTGLQRRQVSAIAHVLRLLWHGFLKDYAGEVIILGDHGESFGENHKLGHGSDIHPCQFEVPFVYGKKEE